MAKKKKKKLRLKRKAKEVLTYVIIFIGLCIYGTINGIKIYKFYEYRKTDEYKLISIGYPKEDALKLIELLPKEDINNILTEEYNEIYCEILNSKYFIKKNFNKYVEYSKYHTDTDIPKVISLINVHANEGWYESEYESDTSKEYLVIANKFYHLPDNYERSDIKSIPLTYSYEGQEASEIVIDAFIQMHDDIQKELGIHLMVNSSYRSYNSQEEIYNDFKTVSIAYADSYAARPGYSEHQTGLALDITSLEHKTVKTFKESDEFTWLKNNCYKYGFILRYPEGKDDITGYSTEEWHFRYVGKDVAKQIYDENITFDEYYAFYVENKN